MLLDLGSRAGASPGREVRVEAREVARWPREAVSGPEVAEAAQKGAACPRHGLSGLRDAMRDAGGEGSRPPASLGGMRQARRHQPGARTGGLSGAMADERRHLLGRVVADGLSLRWRGSEAEGGRVMEIGVASAGNRRRMLKLRFEGGLALAAGSSALPLSEVLRFGEGGYRVDHRTHTPVAGGCR